MITDAQLLRESGDVCIDSGMSDHILVWQRILGNRSVQLDGGVLISMLLKGIVKHYKAEAEAFSDGMEKGGMRGNELVEGGVGEHC